VLVVGVAYKPGVEDLRGTPALDVWRGLAVRGARVSYFDPFVPRLVLDGVEHRSEAIVEPDAYDLVIVCTRHPEVDYGALLAARRLLDFTYRAVPEPAGAAALAE
jgi:UDP-N-acetyl-D-mannosaminuronate dehydrogenase